MSATSDASAVGHAAAAHDVAHAAHAHGNGHWETSFLWRPHIDLLDCRYHGLWLHALLMVALALGAIPLASRKLVAPRVFVAASAGLLLAALGMRVTQSVCVSRGGTASLAAGNIHAAVGWAATAAATVCGACTYHNVQCNAAAAHARALARRVAHAAFGVEMGLLAWGSVIWLVATFLCLLTGACLRAHRHLSPSHVDKLPACVFSSHRHVGGA